MTIGKVLILCGPTATGKTSFALKLAESLPVELISADSRQVYIGMDIVTGKDIPPEFKLKSSRLRWRDRNLGYFTDGNTKIWLQDIVYPNEPFNIAFWRECADLAISDIHKRGKLPVVVGGTGLYFKSLTRPLSQITVPPNQSLRQKFATKSARYLFNLLARSDPVKAASLNISDRQNPRRLIRALEISLNKSKSHQPSITNYQFLSIGLTATRDALLAGVDKRVIARISSGAEREVSGLLAKGYDWSLPGMTACGYPAWKEYLQNFRSSKREESLKNLIARWQHTEHSYIRRQISWFSKQPEITWFNVADSSWQSKVKSLVENWYNN